MSHEKRFSVGVYGFEGGGSYVRGMARSRSALARLNTLNTWFLSRRYPLIDSTAFCADCGETYSIIANPFDVPFASTGMCIPSGTVDPISGCLNILPSTASSLSCFSRGTTGMQSTTTTDEKFSNVEDIMAS